MVTVFDWFYWPGAPSSGSRPCTSSNPTHGCAGIGTCFVGYGGKSKPKDKRGRKPLTEENIALIKQMARENLTWGAERIRGELLKLRIEVSKSTIQKYMNQVREPADSSKQTWSTFLRNHATQIWACDFVHTYDLFFRSVFAFVIIELGSRRLLPWWA